MIIKLLLLESDDFDSFGVVKAHFPLKSLDSVELTVEFVILREELINDGLNTLHNGDRNVLPLSWLYLLKIFHLEVIFIPTAYN